ncbi:tail protein [Serratia phage vB_SspM_BZS1]|nr:tail protein [Serratia phage vB_SspM_BZS1]
MQKVGNTTDTADSNGEYTNGNVAQGIPPTIINAEMLNTFQREMVNVVEGSGITLDPSDNGQLLKGIKKTIKDEMIASLNSSGFQEFPSGLIIQWGAVLIAANSTQENDFPKPFSINCFSLQVTLTYPGPNVGVNAGATSKSKFGIQNYANSAAYFQWIAIGV